MRLQFVFLPDPTHRAGMDSVDLGQRSRAPMSLALRFGFQSGLDNLLRQSGLRLAAPPFRNLPERGGSTLSKSSPPQPTSVAVEVQLLANAAVRPTLIVQQQ